MVGPRDIASAQGKLGVLLVGLGAVSTTAIAGVAAIRKGLAKPVGSLTQMATIRLGKRTEARSPLIRDFVPLAALDDLVFGAWDIFDDNCYEAAKTAGVLDDRLRDALRPELEAIRPWPAVFDRRYVTRLDGPHVKQAKTKRGLADQVRDDIRRFKQAHGLARLVMVVRQHRDLHGGDSGASISRGLRARPGGERRVGAVEHDLRVCGAQGRGALCQQRAESDHRFLSRL
jgi:myo-inositol-1-phosphate synthase